MLYGKASKHSSVLKIELFFIFVISVFTYKEENISGYFLHKKSTTLALCVAKSVKSDFVIISWNFLFSSINVLKLNFELLPPIYIIIFFYNKILILLK